MRVSLSALAFVAASVTLAAQTPSAPTGGSTPASGAMSTFHSDALHLSYSYPAGYSDASSTVGPAFEASMNSSDSASKDKDLMHCISLPFSVMNNAAGQFSLVMLARADASCMKKKSFDAAELATFAHGEIQGLTASGAHTKFDEPVAFNVEGHPAQLLHGTFQLPTGQSLHVLVVCTLIKPDVACWQFLASNEEALHAMSAFPVTLEGAQAAPLVPATAFARP